MPYEGDERRTETRRSDDSLIVWRLNQLERVVQTNAQAVDALERLMYELPQHYLPRQDADKIRKRKVETVALYFAGLGSLTSFAGTLFLFIHGA